MTDSEKELVARLRTMAKLHSNGNGWVDPIPVGETLAGAAADAIERLSAQVEDAKALLGGDGGLKTLRSLREQVAALTAALERAAKACEQRAHDRFEEHGYTEPDTNASYYQGRAAEMYEAMDEEDQECAAAVREIARAALKEAKHD